MDMATPIIIKEYRLGMAVIRPVWPILMFKVKRNLLPKFNLFKPLQKVYAKG